MAVLKYKKKDGSYATLTNISVKPIDPVQTTGNSVTDIMSQNAVTVELANKLAVSDFNTYSGNVNTTIGNKVDKVEGKALSTNDFTTDYKNKLDSVASGANVNVNADWDAVSGDALILNKPTLGTAAAKGVTTGITNSDNLIESKHIYSGVGATIAYDSDSKYIQLKSTSGNVISSFDASAFIKDGMVDNVTISGGNLNIIFNTDAGKETISLPLTDIFNPSNYYTTAQTSGASEISTALAAKTDTATTTALNNVVTGHTANTSIHLSSTEKTNLDSLETNIAAISGITSTKVGNWDGAAAASHTHSNKSALDAITGNVGTMAYENTSSYSSATQVSTALSGKSNTGHTHTKSEITDFPSSMPASDVYDWAKASNKPSYSASEITGLGNSATLNTGTTAGTVAAGDHTHSQYLTGITSGDVIGALGYTPPTADTNTTYAAGSFVSITGSNNSINVTTGTSSSSVARGDHDHSGVYQPVGSYLTAITSGDVTTALGFTPMNNNMLQYSAVTTGASMNNQVCPVTLTTDGQQCNVIYKNSSVSNIEIAISTSYTTPDGQALKLTVKGSGYGEVNYLYYGGTIYARGV